MRPAHIVRSWGKILSGRTPLLSIEITRECPLRCPGCYAYGDSHLGEAARLKDLSDFRGDDLVHGILELVERHDPIHVSLVGGEPLIRHRELSRVLPVLSARGTHTMVVTSAVIPIPREWTALPRVTIAVSIDGLPQHHDERRKPATYERILRNIEGRKVNVHCTIVRAHVQQDGYLNEFLALWSARPEIHRIWFSIYTPQVGEETPEMLGAGDRRALVEQLPQLSRRYPKLLLPDGMAQAFLHPPANPRDCIFSRMSMNYSADLRTKVEPCVFGGTPDCSQCGCSISAGLHWIGSLPVIGPVRARHLMRGSMALGRMVNRVVRERPQPVRWTNPERIESATDLVQIG